MTIFRRTMTYLCAASVTLTASSLLADQLPGQPVYTTLGEQENAATQTMQPTAIPPDARAVSLVDGPGVWREDEPPTSGGLWGKKIAIEAGHGLTWRGSFWGWQREDWFPGRHVHSSQEDYNTARMVNRWLLPYLRNAGADVYPDRCPDEQTNEVLFDAPVQMPATLTGSWQATPNSSARGGTYFYSLSTASSAPTAVAQIRADIPEDGYYGVNVWYPNGWAPATDAPVTVVDAAGNRHPFRVDQSRNTGEWVWLDRFYFEAGDDVLVMEISNQTSVANKQVLLDGVRLGGGMGSEDFGGGPSGVPRWQETATCWTKYNGAPSSVWQANLGQTHDYSVRFNYAIWQDADLLLRLHTNGSTFHTGFGSEAYQYAPDSATLTRLGYIYPKIIQSVRNHYRPTWTNRGVKANAVSGWSFPYVLVELGFHDWLTDAQAMMDADFRRMAMRGYYEGTIDFFTNKTGAYLPEPPVNLAVYNTGDGMVRAEWTSSTVGTAPESYRVYYSTHPHCYKDYVETTAPLTSVEVGLLAPGQVYYFQFRSRNDGGLSLPSETLVAMTSANPDARRTLLVNGFDRFDWDIDETDNQRNYCKEHAVALADAATSIGMAIVIDSASNEAVSSGRRSLTGYALVNWQLGQESAADETFSAAEQAAVSTYREQSGVLVVSGTDVASDLGTSGTLEDKAFLEANLGVQSAAGRIFEPEALEADSAGVFAGLNLTIDQSTGTYNLLGLDGVNAGAASSTSYVEGDVAVAVQSIAQPSPLFFFSFPLETIAGAENRRAVMERILPFTPDKARVGEWSLY